MLLPDFILKLIGKNIAGKLDLKEDTTMNEAKPWFQSKTIWTAIITALIGIYNAIGAVKNLPPVPDWVFTILGGIGVYTRSTATTKIG